MEFINFELSKEISDFIGPIDSDYSYCLKTGKIYSKNDVKIFLCGECCTLTREEGHFIEVRCDGCGELIRNCGNFEAKCKCSIWNNGLFSNKWVKNIREPEDFIPALHLSEAIKIISENTNQFTLKSEGNKISLAFQNGKGAYIIKTEDNILQTVESALRSLYIDIT